MQALMGVCVVKCQVFEWVGPGIKRSYSGQRVEKYTCGYRTQFQKITTEQTAVCPLESVY